MIDVIVNEAGGLTVAHDNKTLDGYTGLDIAMADGATSLTGPDGERSIGALKPSMLAMIADAMPGRMIRISGWSLAKIAPLIIRTRQ